MTDLELLDRIESLWGQALTMSDELEELRRELAARMPAAAETQAREMRERQERDKREGRVTRIERDADGNFIPVYDEPPPQ